MARKTCPKNREVNGCEALLTMWLKDSLQTLRTASQRLAMVTKKKSLFEASQVGTPLKGRAGCSYRISVLGRCWYVCEGQESGTPK